ncbi:hypothetical protein MNBD_NITROSPINAE02-1185 [hydrothermal vent metagenome]|uniref:Cytochrome c domain-containing protein n=1 Tax=hydrothermal vent metagenome TaxID=652676 RepID=A0A3B1DA19_9ZZZZ
MEEKVEKSKTKKSRIPVPAKVAIVWIGAYLILKLAIKPPLPSSLIFMYMTAITVGLALSVSIFEDLLNQFLGPIYRFLSGESARTLPVKVIRWALLIAIPLNVGYGVYQRVLPRFEPPIASRVIHPAPPPEVAALYNDLRDDEANLKKNIKMGEVIYFQNCFFCHGDALDGEGPYAHGINPAPANFQDTGTIAQLTESFVFWRISTGGPGLPDESTPWDSFMPKWETMLTIEERWQVILYLYDLTGWSPRTWGSAETAGSFDKLAEAEEAAEAKAAKEEAAAKGGGEKKAGGLEATRKIYNKRCAPCHGEKGGGDGPAANFMYPHPRNFTWGLFKLRTTPTGFPPTDEDLFRTIRTGMPGSAMPGWPLFSDDEVKGLIEYIKGFSPDTFEDDEKPEVIEVGTPPKATPELIERGKELFTKSKCFECHGKQGRGDTMKLLKDDWGQVIYPRNLTHPWEYRRGSGALENIYLAVSTGLDGTPMPSFKEDPNSLPDEDRWALAHYVKSLQSPRKVGLTILAKLVETIPNDADDPVWDGIGHLDIPLIGQVVADPRLFTPRVDNIRVQAVYNDSEMALKLVWDDTTNTKPDPAAEIFEDTVSVQFPVAIPTGTKRPYFLMGDEDNPVHLWRWSQERSGIEELNAKGMHEVKIQGDSGNQVAAKLKYENGQYQMILKRPLSTPDKDLDIQFESGKFIPILFFASDGSNKETGVKSSISAWYFLLLEPVTPATVYLYPFLVILATGGALWWIIRSIRKNNKHNGRIA